MARYILQAFVLLYVLLNAGNSMGFWLTLPSTSVNNAEISRNAAADDYSDAPTFASDSNPSSRKRDLGDISSTSSTQPFHIAKRQTRTPPNSLPMNRPAVILPRSSLHRLRKRQGSLLKQEETIGLLPMLPATDEMVTSVEKHEIPMHDCGQNHRLSQSTVQFDGPREDHQKLINRISADRLGHVTTRRSSNIPVQDRRPALQIFIVRNIA